MGELLPFPKRAAPQAIADVLPSITASLDVMNAYRLLVTARVTGRPVPAIATLRDGMVQLAAQALLGLNDFDEAQARDRDGWS